MRLPDSVNPFSIAKHEESRGELMFVNKNRSKSCRVRFLTSLLISLLTIFTGAAVVSAYNTDITKLLSPPDYITFHPPAAGQSYTDPVFGTAIKRISDAMHTKNAASGAMTVTISQEYPTVSPFNIDNTRLLLGHLSYFALYDGAGNYLRDLWPNPGIVASSEPRWSKKDPNEFYYISGNRFMKYNVGTNASTTIHTFSEYASISEKGEEDISADGDHFAFA